MTDNDLMLRAIDEMQKCNPTRPEMPKVGAIIAVDGEVIAAGYRGTKVHAEKAALSQLEPNCNLSNATVYTTLEPCTRHVRRLEGDSCADRLSRMQPKKVVIGILDPNQGVCGRGVLQLQNAGIEVELFPHLLAQQIRRLNDPFIQSQQSLGIRITSPQDGAEIRESNCIIRGTFRNPFGDRLIAATWVDGHWWPQLDTVKQVPGEGNVWQVTVNFGIDVPHKVSLVKVNELGMVLVNYYRRMVRERDATIVKVAAHFKADLEIVRQIVAPIFWSFTIGNELPHGFDQQDSITLHVKRQ